MKEKLREEMKASMKARNNPRVQGIRGLLAAIQYEEMQKETDNLSEDQVTAVLKTELKKRKESLEYAEKDNRAEMIAEIKAEIALIESFLPQQLSDQDLEKIIVDLKNENPAANMGAIMKSLKEKFSGQYDGKMASDIAKRVLG